MTLAMIKIWLVAVTIWMFTVSKIRAEPQVPCFFVFGDSLLDSGNNNDLSTAARVDYKPYGIDFQGGVPTGRFTNGRTVIDILAQKLGFENFIPNFKTAQSSNDILQGVNYASGSAGILGETGSHLGKNVNFYNQYKNHVTIVSRFPSKLGSEDLANTLLNKCLYYVGLGSNDYINNYYQPQWYNSSKLLTPEQFATRLIKRFKCRVLKLYKFGARKVALAGIGQIGCAPTSMTRAKTKGCVDYMNRAVQLYNAKLLALVDSLNANLLDAKFIYINVYAMGGGDASAVGFKVWDRPCCKANDIGQCVPSQTPCSIRQAYVFWDGYHPTEIVNLITATRIYNSNDLSDCYPLDVSQLIQWSSHQT